MMSIQAHFSGHGKRSSLQLLNSMTLRGWNLRTTTGLAVGRAEYYNGDVQVWLDGDDAPD
jgi:hypothetical protein